MLPQIILISWIVLKYKKVVIAWLLSIESCLALIRYFSRLLLKQFWNCRIRLPCSQPCTWKPGFTPLWSFLSTYLVYSLSVLLVSKISSYSVWFLTPVEPLPHCAYGDSNLNFWKASFQWTKIKKEKIRNKKQRKTKTKKYLQYFSKVPTRESK